MTSRHWILVIVVLATAGGAWLVLGRKQPTRLQEAPPIAEPRGAGKTEEPAPRITLAPSESRTGAGGPSPAVGQGDSASPAADPVGIPEVSETEWKRRWLRDCIKDLEATDPKNAERQVEHALVTSIVAVMDAAGTAMPRGNTKQNLTELQRPGFQLFLHNNSYYTFRVGEFPEYDEFLEYRARRGHWEESSPRASAGPDALAAWRASEPAFPVGLVPRAMDRASEALALIE